MLGEVSTLVEVRSQMRVTVTMMVHFLVSFYILLYSFELVIGTTFVQKSNPYIVMSGILSWGKFIRFAHGGSLVWG